MPLTGRYVAMGSSFAAGSGTGPDIGAGCQRAADNYPHVVAKRFGLNLVDVTCAGATIANLFDTPQDGRPAQLDAVTPDTRLVTITAGGNDLDYSSAIQRCMEAARASKPCPGLPAAADLGQAAVKLHSDLVRLIGALRADAPDARIYLLGYPRIFPDPPATCTDNNISAADTGRLTSIGLVLDATLRRSAADADVSFVDVYTASIGHDVCASSTDRWLNGSDTYGIYYHPNATGVARVADLLAEALEHRESGQPS
ncbi:MULTISPECIES: SGNH/GDSL hydrolase family protein [unclassified Frankia]|uniref:SGNH/GDSL hydrolase family protein n=1 Tax=unclassified Frankia TaxID=2632575 RepID=UPI0027DE8C44|nr:MULTISPECIES: SGNH/GDSL hydrolase family protein [unclassified Frankia]